MSGHHPWPPPMKRDRGPYVQTATGGRFYLLNPRPSEVKAVDIAAGLSRLARFNGAVDFYSVAEHCVMVSYLAPREYALAGLLHDAAEAYVGDVTTPVKHALRDLELGEQSSFDRLEARTLGAVATHFGVAGIMSPQVKQADSIALAIEIRDLVNAEDRGNLYAGQDYIPGPVLAAGVRARKWSPAVAEFRYLERLEELGAS